jgi:hypothetical protein
MAEHIREVSVTIEVDTNKQTKKAELRLEDDEALEETAARMNIFCPHGYQWGNGDGMYMDHASDGCVYEVTAETALVRERAALIRKLEMRLRDALNRDTFLAKALLIDIKEASSL